MATIVPGSMAGSNATLARTIAAADSDYAHAVIADSIDCSGLKRILVVAEKTAGSGTPTVSIQPCLHVVTARTTAGAPDTQVLAKGDTQALADGDMAILDVYGRNWTLHVPAITAGSTWKLHVAAYEPFWADASRVG